MMFSWIEKAIPHPPETPTKISGDGQEAAAAPPMLGATKCAQVVCLEKEGDQASAGSGSHESSDKSSGGVLSWLAQGLGKVVPQPVDSPTLQRASKEVTECDQKPQPVEETVLEKRTENGASNQPESSSLGVLSWLSQGLEKVVPQPVWCPRASSEAAVVVAEQKPQMEEKPEKVEACVAEVNFPPASPAHSPVPSPVAAPPPAPMEVLPAATKEAETAPLEKGSGVGVLNWLMQGLEKVVPQPETVTTRKVEEEKPKEEVPPPIVSRKDSKGSADSIGVLSWITYGLEKVIPQPVTAKQESQDAPLCQVQERGAGCK